MEIYDVSTFFGEKNTKTTLANDLNVIDYIQKLLSVSNLDEIHKICVAICHQYGYDFFTTIMHINRPNKPLTIFRMVEHVNDFTIHYEKNRFFLTDPGIRIAKSTATPYALSTATDKHRLSDAERSVILDASDFGMREVFYAPFHGVGGDFGAVRFVHDSYGQCTPGDDVKRLNFMSELFILASYIYSATVRIINNEVAGVSLGQREKEVLLRIAVGDNPVKISDLLKISEHTVRNHLKSIRCKLGVRSTTHAVAKAISSNIITL